MSVVIESESRFVNELVRKTKVASPMDDSMHLWHREGRHPALRHGKTTVQHRDATPRAAKLYDRATLVKGFDSTAWFFARDARHRNELELAARRVDAPRLADLRELRGVRFVDDDRHHALVEHAGDVARRHEQSLVAAERRHAELGADGAGGCRSCRMRERVEPDHLAARRLEPRQLEFARCRGSPAGRRRPESVTPRGNDS